MALWHREQVNLGNRPPPRIAPRHWLDALFCQAAFLIPMLVTVFRASSAPVWQADLPLVRALGLVPAGTEGRLTSVLVELSSLLPLGGRWLRAAWVGAFALALSSYLIYLLARRVLEKSARTPRLTPALSLAAALTATLAQSFQREGTVAGGAALSSALVLSGLVLGFEAERRTDARLAPALGALLALTLSESHAAALVLGLSLLALGAVHWSLPRAQAVLGFSAGFVLVVLLSGLPIALRPLAAQGGLDFGHGLDGSSLASIEAADARITALSAWLTDMGVISFALALGGLALGVLRRSTRGLVALLLILVLGDLSVPVSHIGVLTPDAFGSLRLLAIGALAVCAALAVQTSALALMRARVPFAEPASVLLVVFDFSLVFVGAEDSAFAAEQRGERAAEVWTDQALASVPPDGLLLLQSQAVAWRLLASRIVRGERPDIVLVPMPLLERGNVRARLLASEPALAPLIREVALSGRPSEYALSTLADARPLLLELDPQFDHAQLEHLIPGPFFMRFAPQPLGRSDRVAASWAGAEEIRRVVEATERDGNRDVATRSVLLAELRGQAWVAATLNDHANLELALSTVHTLDPSDTLAADLAAERKAKPRAPLSLARISPAPAPRIR